MPEVSIKRITCCNCGVLFWVATEHHEELVRSGDTFYCPNNHGQSFNNSEARKIEELERKLNRSRDREREARRDHAVAEKQRQGYKGAFGSEKKRRMNAEKELRNAKQKSTPQK